MPRFPTWPMRAAGWCGILEHGTRATGVALYLDRYHPSDLSLRPAPFAAKQSPGTTGDGADRRPDADARDDGFAGALSAGRTVLDKSAEYGTLSTESRGNRKVSVWHSGLALLLAQLLEKRSYACLGEAGVRAT